MEKTDKYRKIVSLELISNWDTWNSTWLTNKVYRIAQKHKVNFSIKGKVGSLDLVFGFFLGIASSFVGNLLYDELKYYIKKRRQKVEKENKKYLSHLILKVNGKKEEI